MYAVRISLVVGHKNLTQTNSNVKENLLVYAIRNWKRKAGFKHGRMETVNEHIQNLPLLLQLLALFFFGLALFSSCLSSNIDKDDHQQQAWIGWSKMLMLFPPKTTWTDTSSHTKKGALHYHKKKLRIDKTTDIYYSI